ncbi:type VII secretion integral membrane protein EccD [Streptomyces xiamenensis]|uniref:type VII secretion integral membrane protein EccD n=1 Tax=Streptomyces xiamenensis TaxID=408015 RepID=UPI0035DE6989
MSVELQTRGPANTRRVTLVGEYRRVDVVLSADEPVGVLLPEILRLLGDRPGPYPLARRLTTPSGRVLAPESSLAFAAVQDGTVLRLIKETEAPVAPVVHDVTDEVADDLPPRAWRWGDRSRVWTSTAALAVLVLTAALLTQRTYGVEPAAPYLAGAALLAMALGAVAAPARAEATGGALIGTGAALGVLLAGRMGAAGLWQEGQVLALSAAVVAVALLLLGLVTPLGRGGWIGAAAVAVTAGIWLANGALIGTADSTGQARLGAVMIAVTVCALGLLPRLALMTAGLTRLDDQHAAGRPTARREVTAAITAAHRGLALTTVVMAASAVAAGFFALRVWGPWSVALTCALMAVLLSRSRETPLAVSAIALQTAAGALALRLAWEWDTDGPAAVAALLLAALIPVLALSVRPAEHVRVRTRRAVAALESLAVLATLPLVVGAFGVYGQLLNTF